MTRTIVASILLSLCGNLSPAGAGDLADLSQLLENARDYWPEGAMECEVRGQSCTVDGVEQTYKVRAYWKEGRYRFEYNPLNANGKPADAGWVIIRGGEGFRFMRGNQSAVLTATAGPGGIEDSLRVLPNMSWLNLPLGRSLSGWVSETVPKLDHVVTKESNGSYRLSLEQDGVEHTFVEFTNQGLPVRFRAQPPGGQVRESRAEWLDRDGEEFPRPVKLVQYIELVGGKRLTLLEINVSEFRSKLQRADPSLAIPPADLPRGILIRDLR